VFIATCLSCAPPVNSESTESEYYDVTDLMDQLISNHLKSKIAVTKYVQVDKKTEKHIFSEPDSAFWHQELAMLYAADLNKPINQDRYEQFVAQDDSTSNLKFINYRIKTESKSGVQWESIYFLHDLKNIRKFEYELLEKNALFYSKRSVGLWINQYGSKIYIDSLRIVGISKMMGQDSVTFLIRTKTNL